MPTQTTTDATGKKKKQKFLCVNSLTKHYATSVRVLTGLDLIMAQNERLIVIGPSGGGKSTLLRCVMGLEKIQGGTITLDGRSYIVFNEDKKKTIIDKHIQQQVGMVFQHYTLFPHLTVIGNLILSPTKSRKEGKRQAVDRGMELLDRFGLAEKAKSYPSQLSGGQKQRVAIARALMLNPKLMLFDEVTSALDPELVTEVQKMIVELADQGMPMMIVTHDMWFAKNIATRVIFCADGIVFDDGPPDEIFTNPRNERTREFVECVIKAH